MPTDGGNIQSKWSLDSSDFVAGVGKTQGSVSGALPILGQLGMVVTGLKAGLDMAVGAFSAVAGAIAGVVKPAAEFQTKIQEIKSLGVDKDVAAIGNEVDDLTMKFGQESQNVIKAYYDSISAGVDEQKVTGFLETAAKLATVGVTDIGTAVDGLTSTLNAYGQTADKANVFSDALFTAVQKGKTTIPELSDAIGRVAPTASAMGISIQELTGTIATMTSQGIKTSEATSGLKAALANVIKPTAEAGDSLKALNAAIESNLDPTQKMAIGIGEGGLKFDALTVKSQGLNGALLPVIQAIQAVKEKMEAQIEAAGGLNKVSEETRSKYAQVDGAISGLFGSIEGYNAIVALAANGGETWNANLQALKDSTGEVDKQFQGFADNTGFKFGQLSETWKTLKKDAGELFLGVLANVAGVFTPIIKAVDDWVESNKELIQQNLSEWFSAMSEAIGNAWKEYIKPAWEWISDFISGDMPGWSAGIKLLAITQGFQWTVIKDSISAAWSAILPIWEAINQWVSENFGDWGGFIQSLTEVVSQAFTEIWTIVQDVFKGAWDTVKHLWDTIIKPFWEWLDKNIQLAGGWKVVFLAFKESIHITFTAIGETLNTFWDVAKTVIDAVKLVFDTAFTAIGVVIDLFQGNTDKALEKVTGYWKRFKETIFGIFDRFKETFESWKDWYVGVLKRLGVESKEAMGESYIPDAWEAGRVHLKRIWDATIENMSGFYDKWKSVITAIAEDTADKLTQQRLTWIKAFADQNDIWNKGLSSFELAMTRFGHGNDAFLEKVRNDFATLVEYQRTGNIRSSQLWEDLFNSSQNSIMNMGDRFGYLSDKAQELFGLELPSTMAEGAADVSYYMDQMTGAATRGSGMFAPLIEAIDSLKAALKELQAALDEAVGHSWFTDSMIKFRDAVKENWVAAMQDIEYFAEIGVKGIDKLRAPLAAVTEQNTENSTVTNNSGGNTINVNNPSFGVTAQSLPTAYTLQMAGNEVAKGFLRSLRTELGV